MVCHCLLLETKHGLMLVDTGYGRDDVRHPVKRLGAFFYNLTRPTLRMDECAAEQIVKMGKKPQDVKHIFISHFDLDHIGGLSDFPNASVHCLKDELDALNNRRFFKEMWGYRNAQVAHHPNWVPHECHQDWFGFEAAQPLKDEPDILMVSLPGHSRGHAGVAIRQGAKWLLYVGDAFFHPDQLKQPPKMPLFLRLFQNLLVTIDKQKREQTLEQLRKLVRDHSDEIDMVNGHNYDTFLAYTKSS